jgi:hypothetical protein
MFVFLKRRHPLPHGSVEKNDSSQQQTKTSAIDPTWPDEDSKTLLK